jgi:hypothetical protein
MQEIFDTFAGRSAGDGVVRVEEQGDHDLVWLSKQVGADFYRRLGIAHIRRDGDTYKVVWLHGPDDQPSDEVEYGDLHELNMDGWKAIWARAAE